MSLAEIEAELEKLSSEDLRRLALKSWAAFVEKEGCAAGASECSEDDPRLLAALDQAIANANSTAGQGHSASAVRARLNEWTSR
jgi:hypothetical protein